MPKNTNCSTTCQNILNILILQQFHFHHNSSVSNLYVIWFWQRMLSTSIILTKQAYIIHLYTKSPRCQNSNDNGPVQLLLSQNKRPKIAKIPSQISLTPKIPQKLSPIHQQDIFISDYTTFSLTSVFPDFPAGKQIPKWVSIKDINSFKYKYNHTYYTHTNIYTRIEEKGYTCASFSKLSSCHQWHVSCA